MNHTWLLMTLLVAGCDWPNPPAQPTPAKAPVISVTEGSPEAQDSVRFKVHKEAEFFDATAWNGTRRIYTIKDEQTGKTYLGVTGVGISEVGVHQEERTSTTADFKGRVHQTTTKVDVKDER